jgi:hypothetical protein
LTVKNRNKGKIQKVEIIIIIAVEQAILAKREHKSITRDWVLVQPSLVQKGVVGIL